MLASPDLESEEHALMYLRKSVRNVAIDALRLEHRRPNLMLIDESLDASLLWQQTSEHSQVLEDAENAAIVRQALALLSPAQRTALVMWEIDGRSAEEIANELGIKKSSVRQTLARARFTFKKILTELIIDEDKGLTALDLLSNNFRRIAAGAKKASSISLSVLLLFGLGTFLKNDFWADTDSFKPNLSVISPVKPGILSTSVLSQIQGKSTDSEIKSSEPALERINDYAANLRTKYSKFSFLNSDGVPTGFVVADSNGLVGSAKLLNRGSEISQVEIFSSQIFKTVDKGTNLLMVQKIYFENDKVRIEASLAFGSEGVWIPYVSQIEALDTKRVSSGGYLISAILSVGEKIDGSVKLPVTSAGEDLTSTPRKIELRILMDETKTDVTSQSLYVQF